MRILMLGWEYPPFISGGLGTACRGLTEAMKGLQARILFVLPRSIETESREEDDDDGDLTGGVRESASRSEFAALPGGGLETLPVPSAITDPYSITARRPARLTRRIDDAERRRRAETRMPSDSSVRVVGVGAEDGYDGDLVGKIEDYARRCVGITRRELFDVIHAHDWMTLPAAMAISEFSGRPLIAHIHATEFDRSGEWGNLQIYEIERRGMHAAARVIAVSERTKQIIVKNYGVPASKVVVVHNGIESRPIAPRKPREPRREKVVLFLGRVTRQKGPEFFVRAAARVAERLRNVRFVVAGTGDQLPRMVGLSRELGIDHLVEFKGFLNGAEVDRAYESADVYVMPSVSEPFGLTALEAVRHGVPVVLSKESGVAEVLRNGTLKVDSWDVELTARMIVSVLQYPSLADMLRRVSLAETRGLTWEEAARKCIRLYYDTITAGSGRSRRYFAAAAAS